MGIEGMWRKFLDRAKSNPVEDYDANAYEELRHVAYEVVFGGKAANVVVEAAVTPPFPVGVHLFNEPPKLSIIMPGGASATPTQPRNWTTLATMGMSNERMPNPPAHVRPEMGRVELLFHVSWRALDATPDLIHFCADMLMFFAKYPFLEERLLAPGHIVPVCVIGQGMIDFLGDPSVSRLLVMPAPPDAPGGDLEEHLELGGDPVSFLALVPITEEELQFYRKHGVAELLEQGELPGVYDGPRRSSVPAT